MDVVGKVNSGRSAPARVHGDRDGIIKVVGDKRYGKLVGGHISARARLT